jgi:hypothetical protein
MNSNNNPNPNQCASAQCACAGQDQNAECQSSRSRKWKIVLLIFAIMILVGGTLVLKYGKRFSEPYKMGMVQIRANEQVQKAFGQPISDDSWIPSGELTVDEANLRWDLTGPNGKGKAYVKARKTGEKWEIVRIEVTPPEGKVIVLQGEGTGNDAPGFNPQGAAPTNTSTPAKTIEVAPPSDPNLNITLPDEATEQKK